jgi:hypothetical protein
MRLVTVEARTRRGSGGNVGTSVGKIEPPASWILVLGSIPPPVCGRGKSRTRDMAVHLLAELQEQDADILVSQPERHTKTYYSTTVGGGWTTP